MSVLWLCVSASGQQIRSTEAVYQTRYLAAHGRRALLGGNAAAGLEAWVYPLEIVRGLEPSFRVGTAAEAQSGKALLREMIYSPTYVERVYRAASFTVRERLFVPRDLPGAVLTYTVESTEPVAVEVRFTPVFDLMWPVGMGGQEVHWQSAESAYRMDEPTGRFFAMVGSPDAQAQDDLINTHAPLSADPRLTLVLTAAPRARLLLASDSGGWDATRAVYQTLLTRGDALESEAQAEVEQLSAGSTAVETPDQAVNDALAWSETALDQAWVTNPKLGSGLVAGYGPSRGMARRPQYDWFFADDALVSLPALLLSGAQARARDVLLFLLNYQNPQSGMMWHELSQSAGYVDWARDYPYMFPHVDVTFRFLIGVAEYVRATGDLGFVREHWHSLAAAYDYCLSLIDAGDGLPRVPPGKEGHDEQDHPREELELAVDWMGAASSFAELARDSGHGEQAEEAEQASQRARATIPEHFWNRKTSFWNSGIDAAGNGLGQLRMPSPASLDLLDEPRRGQVLDRVAGAGFQTPWGARDTDTSSRGYDANSYATGSVWAASTALAAEDLWQGGRSGTAWQVWRKLLPWLNLDSLGHLHETLSATRFEPQTESVPEQTWSSALLLSSFMEGLAGVRLDAPHRTVEFQPRLPPEWPTFAIRRLRLGASSIDLSLAQHAQALELTASAKGAAVTVDFRPQAPAGLVIERLLLDNRPACARETAEHRACPIALADDGQAHTVSVQFRKAG